jgi:signal transduction histidine kinase
VDFHRAGSERRLERNTELVLYRIAQEALSNVMRHAQAKNAAIGIRFDSDRVKLEISDDGIGFEIPASPTDFARSGHFGLLGMKERADLIGAQFAVESQTGTGTKILVSIKQA